MNGASIEEACDYTISYIDISDDLNCPTTITRTFTITDACGNSSSDTQDIVVNDTVNPLITAPNDIVLEACIADASTITDATTGFVYNENSVILDAAQVTTYLGLNGASIEEACDYTISYIDVSDSSNCPTTITRTFTITDACGNSENDTQYIVMNDTTEPLITAPDDITIEACVADENTISAASAGFAYSSGTSIILTPEQVTTYLDLNGANVTELCSYAISYIDQSDGLSCPTTVTRTFTITDACGNTNTDDQKITIENLLAPEITAPSGYGINGCDVTALSDYSTEPVDISTESGIYNYFVVESCDYTVTYVDELETLSCESRINRTFTVTDACGLTGTSLQVITIMDTEAPVIVLEPEINLECSDEILTPYVTDNCSPDGMISITFVDDVIPSETCPHSYTITRTWTATDECGNSASATQVINIIDTTPPEITADLDYTYTCNPEGNFFEFVDWINDFGANHTQDNCGDTDVFFQIENACATNDTESTTTTSGYGLVTFDPTTSLNDFTAAYNVIYEEDENTGTAYLQFDVFSEFLPNDDFFTEAYEGEVWRIKLYLTDAIYNNNTNLNSYLLDSNLSTVEGVGDSNSAPLIIHNIVVIGNDGRIDIEHDDNDDGSFFITFEWESASDNSVGGSICLNFSGIPPQCCGAQMDKLIAFTVVDECGNITEETIRFTVEDPNCDCTPEVCQTTGAEVLCVVETPQGVIMQLEWDPVNFSPQYLVQYWKQGNSTVFTSTPTNNFTQLTNLEAGETYIYSIHPYCSGVLGEAWNGSFTAICSDFGGPGNGNPTTFSPIKDPNNPFHNGPIKSPILLNPNHPIKQLKTIENENIDLFPNPTRSELNVSFDMENEKGIHIEIYDLLGRKVILKEVAPTVQSTILDVEHLENGNYILLLNDGKKSYMKKFIKIKN